MEKIVIIIQYITLFNDGFGFDDDETDGDEDEIHNHTLIYNSLFSQITHNNIIFILRYQYPLW